MRKGAEKLTKFGNAKQQGRLDGFFTAKPKGAMKNEPEKGKSKDKGTAAKGAKTAKRKASCPTYYHDVSDLRIPGR